MIRRFSSTWHKLLVHERKHRGIWIRFSIMQLIGRKSLLILYSSSSFYCAQFSQYSFISTSSYQKSEEARGLPKVDYTELKPKDAILVITWALFVTPLLGRCGYLIAATGNWGITVDDILNF